MGDYSNPNISAKQAGYKDAYASSTDPSQQLKDQEAKVQKALDDYLSDINIVNQERAELTQEAKDLQSQLASDKTGNTAAKILGLFLLKINSFETSDQLAPTFGRVDVSNQFLALQNLVTKQFNQSLNLTSLAGYDFGDLGKVKVPLTFDSSGNLAVTLKDGTASTISADQVSAYSLQHGVFFKLSDLGVTFEGNPIAGSSGNPPFKAVSTPGGGPSDPGAIAFANGYINNAHEGYFESLRATCSDLQNFMNNLQKPPQSDNPFFQENPDLINSMAQFLSQAISSNDPLATQEAQGLVFQKGSQDAIAQCQSWTSDTASNMSMATGSINSINQRAATMAQTEENLAKGFLDASKNIVQQSLQMLQKITENMPR